MWEKEEQASKPCPDLRRGRRSLPRSDVVTPSVSPAGCHLPQGGRQESKQFPSSALRAATSLKEGGKNRNNSLRQPCGLPPPSRREAREKGRGNSLRLVFWFNNPSGLPLASHLPLHRGGYIEEASGKPPSRAVETALRSGNFPTMGNSQVRKWSKPHLVAARQFGLRRASFAA